MRLINEDDVLRIVERVTNEAVEKNQRKYLIQPRIIAEIAGLPTIEAEPVKHGRWIMREKYKLIPTGKFAVSEGHILHKTSADKPFNLQSANIIPIKEHKKVKIPYCSICGNYGDDEYDRTLYCPYCGARMDGDSE